jgi:hypothetical protein
MDAPRGDPVLGFWLMMGIWITHFISRLNYGRADPAWNIAAHTPSMARSCADETD